MFTLLDVREVEAPADTLWHLMVCVGRSLHLPTTLTVLKFPCVGRSLHLSNSLAAMYRVGLFVLPLALFFLPAHFGFAGALLALQR